MKKLFLILCMGGAMFGNAQEDPKAKAVLDEISKLTGTYKTIMAEVLFTINNKEGKAVEKPQAWKIWVKGNKFKLDIPGTNIVCDGKTLWNYNRDAKEVTIKNFDPENDEQNPSKIFTMYENGYKYKYEKEENVGSAACHVIDLYPLVKPEKKKFHTVKLYSDKKKKQIVRLKMMMKDGGTQVYDVKSLKANTDMPDAMFVMDLKGFKADQINDERD